MKRCSMLQHVAQRCTATRYEQRLQILAASFRQVGAELILMVQFEVARRRAATRMEVLTCPR